MLFNPFPMWFMILVVIPVQILSIVTYLPYFLLKFIGLGNIYKRIHFFVWMNIEQLTLQPVDYFKYIKDINKQIIEECSKL